jgi:hypothetical protein
MRKLRIVFCWLAGAGLVLGLIVHLSTFADVSPFDVFPPVVGLHIGIFVVFIPALLYSNRTKTSGPGGDALIMPRPMIALMVASFIYAMVNFAIFIVRMHEGGPHRETDGTFAVKTHGRFVRALDEAEYHQLRRYEARGASGHWMLFYSWSLAFLAYPQRKCAATEPITSPAGPVLRALGEHG